MEYVAQTRSLIPHKQNDAWISTEARLVRDGTSSGEGGRWCISDGEGPGWC